MAKTLTNERNLRQRQEAIARDLRLLKQMRLVEWGAAALFIAEVAPRYAELAPTAYAQIATAVIITAIMAPILTGWVDKKFCQGKEDLSVAGVEAIEEAVATDIDGE